MSHQPQRILILIIFSICTFAAFSQFKPKEINWTVDGNSTLSIKKWKYCKN